MTRNVDLGTGSVWVVHYGNYHPAEVQALYDNEAAAIAHRDALNAKTNGGMWEVDRWDVFSEYSGETPDV